ncbi:unnamed protein product [Protopolystoma xenopodis]|uniref:Uncharacterized protein n=1 Tax=Protopolystoma xenopodis TaxID=117903 RepID=A0A448WFC8_9PLAT|nr:unnamed protein product [Protopolystoma xenopodis]
MWKEGRRWQLGQQGWAEERRSLGRAVAASAGVRDGVMSTMSCSTVSSLLTPPHDAPPVAATESRKRGRASSNNNMLLLIIIIIIIINNNNNKASQSYAHK